MKGPASVRAVPAAEQEPIFVGRVTGMVDCQWADSKSGNRPAIRERPLGPEIRPGTAENHVQHGRPRHPAGALHIYSRFADQRVSALGRLTAKVEKKPEAGSRKPEGEQSPSNFCH